MFVLSSFSPLISIFVRDELHAGPFLFGVVSAMVGVGLIVSTTVMVKTAGRKTQPHIVLYGLLGLGMATAVLGISHYAWLAAVSTLYVVSPNVKLTSTAEQGYLHCGPAGAGHFVKMVHNGIEYGLMAAYAEGLNILHKANVGKGKQTADAETTPLRDPEHYQYDFNLTDVAEVWRRGSVIASWLLDLTASALLEDPQLSKFAGRVSDSGEGRWTILAAIDESVPAHVLSAALYERFSSRGEADYADKLLSAMRYEFGGHLEKKK